MAIFKQIQTGLQLAIFTSTKLLEDHLTLNKEATQIKLRYQYSGVECTLIDPINPIVSYIEFHIDKNYLDSIDIELFQQLGELNQVKLCCHSQSHLHEMLKSKHKALEEKIFIQSKLLQLILILIEQPMLESESCGSCKFLEKSYERNKITKAKEIILDSLNQALTIPTLAQKVGMNECYLKKGFKEIYGKTIFTYIQDARMQRAKILLKTEELSVSEIAYEVGYSNLSGFSAAFKKQVGVLPSEFALQ